MVMTKTAAMVRITVVAVPKMWNYLWRSSFPCNEHKWADVFRIGGNVSFFHPSNQL
jgi:hypothetical protein